jgi:hypothetical protein
MAIRIFDRFMAIETDGAVVATARFIHLQQLTATVRGSPRRILRGRSLEPVDHCIDAH